jgi:hypothetical protein
MAPKITNGKAPGSLTPLYQPGDKVIHKQQPEDILQSPLIQLLPREYLQQSGRCTDFIFSRIILNLHPGRE